MTSFVTKVVLATGLLFSVLVTEGIVNSALAYRCGQSRPCPGGFNPYNPDSYNHVTEHGYNAFGSIGGVSVGQSQTTKTVHSGEIASVGYFYSIYPNCSSLGHYEIELLSQPHGGSVSVASGKNYPNFPQSNVRSVCNSRKLPVDQVVYHASATFSGEDDFDIETISPDHNARRVHFTIMVE